MNTEEDFNIDDITEEMEYIQDVYFNAIQTLEHTKELIEGLENEKEKKGMDYLLKAVDKALIVLNFEE